MNHNPVIIKIFSLGILLSVCLSTSSIAQENEVLVKPIHFEKKQIASESYESVGVFDVNGDGKPDIISGAFWYEGPDFLNRYFIKDVARHGEYWDDFLTIPLDVNGDGRMDYVTGGWFSKNLRWCENPGSNVPWKEHIIDQTGNVETAKGWDVDNDGYIEIVPNNPRQPLKFYKLKRDHNNKPTGEFIKISVAETQDHGLGFGDVNGDGRGDFIISTGWVEAPGNIMTGKWIVHNEFNLGSAGVPILVADINGDSKNDIIVGQAHSYGLDWYEQTINEFGKRDWIKHSIDPYNSQFHTMELIDLDGDGKDELLTGKRYRAHNGRDPGGNDLIGLYYYKWNGEAFVKQTISYGTLGVGKGTGIYFSTADLRRTGRRDIIVAGKDGLYVFFNQGNE
jgi:hypothetical protein